MCMNREIVSGTESGCITEAETAKAGVIAINIDQGNYTITQWFLDVFNGFPKSVAVREFV